MVDLAQGAACPFLVPFLVSRHCQVIALNDQPTGHNINEFAYMQFENLKKQMITQGADIGIALDGDADRLLVLDETGQLWDGDDLLYLLVHADLNQGVNHAGVVITSLSNEGLVRSLEAINVRTHRTHVGDKYVSRALQSLNWQLGSEPCGHMVDRRSSNVSDPFAIMMRTMTWMKRSGLQLSKAPRPMKDPQRSAVVRNTSKSVDELLAYAMLNYPQVRWVIRASGTEPVLRIMGENAESKALDQAFNDVISFSNTSIV